MNTRGRVEMDHFKKNIRKKLSKYLSFPKDIMLDLPKITTIGNVHTYIENHHGIISYNNKELVIDSQLGHIKFIGNSFTIREMLYKELILEGKVSRVVFLKTMDEGD